MKGFIISDFKKIEEVFFEADKSKDILRMKVQLHKMYPIVSNLQYQDLLTLIAQYQSHQEYSLEFANYNIEFKRCLNTLYQFLETT